jgi:PKD repeat protein
MAKRTARRLALGAVLALVSSACTVSSTNIPPLAGPSEFALSFALTATPDSILQDGSSQASITVTARDVNAKSVPGLIFRLDMSVGNQPGDYGRLSGKTLVTGPDGRATAIYTAPPPPPAGSYPTCHTLPGTCVTISATPVSTGFVNAVSQNVMIHLVPVGVILPPADMPTPQFVITPAPPLTTRVATNFDGSGSCAGPAPGSAPPPVVVPCSPTSNTIVSYSWGFGDGGAAMGRATSHSYSAPGTYTVTLTVTNDGGKFATASEPVTVTDSGKPTPAFVFSPSTPVIGQVVQFNASTSTAVAGRSIVNYVWNWGDGSTGGGQATSHSYALAGAYNVTLTVTDDAGQSATFAQIVNVGLGNPTAVLTVTKSGGTSIQADGSQSTASGSSTIASYTFIWGDGTQSGPSTTPVGSHTYPALVPPALTETFTVTLRVTDNATPPRSGTASQPITVP